MKAKTVLVLGAGASRAYGFPLGSGLAQSIIELSGDTRACESMLFSPTRVRNFVSAFFHGQSNSIDQFLGRRPEFSDVGKAAIAYVLLRCEQKSELFSPRNPDEPNSDCPDHWYKYLLNQITTDTWDTFDPSWLSIVSFNYDRSLRHYLATTLQHQYNKTQSEVLERLKVMKFVHVYGSLGDPFDGVPFGGHRDPEGFEESNQRAAKELVVIPEGRDDAPSVMEAKELLGEAKKIAFLGFGFDQTNIRRLGAPSCFRANSTPKLVVATVQGLYPSEQRRAIELLFGPINSFQSEDIRSRFIGDNCINTLRQTLILD